MYSVHIQKLILALQAIQFGFLSRGYLSGTANNNFTLFDSLFTGELSRICTQTGCWSSLAPFVGSLYASVVFMCLMGMAFRPGRELRLLVIGVAGVSIFMAISRYVLATPAFYPEGVLERLSLSQLLVGGVVMLVAFLPYSQASREVS